MCAIPNGARGIGTRSAAERSRQQYVLDLCGWVLALLFLFVFGTSNSAKPIDQSTLDRVSDGLTRLREGVDQAGAGVGTTPRQKWNLQGDIKAMRRRSERGRGVVVASWAEEADSPAGDIIRTHVAANVHMYRAVKKGRGGEEGEALSFLTMLQLLGTQGAQGEGEGPREALLQALGSSPFDAFFFECVPLPSSSTAPLQSVGFEFVLADAPPLHALTHSPDPGPFAEHFANDNDTAPIKVFPNLGGDALLVSPCPPAPSSPLPLDGFTHLAVYVRSAAPSAHKHALLALAAQSVTQQWQQASESEGNGDEEWVYWSSSGLGVSWLHMRIEGRPKYYTYTPYKTHT